MTFGDPSWGADEATSMDILDRYLDAGGNLIDTANRYMDGASERVIGAYLGKRPGLRDRLVLSTKFALTMEPDDPNSGGTGRKAIHRLGVLSQSVPFTPDDVPGHAGSLFDALVAEPDLLRLTRWQSLERAV